MLAAPEEITADAYLRRWLQAREWDVELTLKCIVRHAGWREHMMPAGYVPEVRVGVGGVVCIEGREGA